MTPSSPAQDLAAQWKAACRLYPIYFELAREFVIDVQHCPDLEAGIDTPGAEVVQQAVQWIEALDQRIQVHQLRQFLQTSSLINQETLIVLLQHFLAVPEKTEAVRDKVDFLLVQYFSQLAPSQLDDNKVDLPYVVHALESVLGAVELKTPVWLNALDRVLDTARRCQSLDELLHGGVLEQGRKAKAQAGDLFFMPIALAAFTRFGYLMRRVFFRLMLGDLNAILDGLNELEDKGIDTIDCRRAQFSEQEPIMRLRMICQSWKVMFQAEYSSGQPLRMLVDLRASVEHALGRGNTAKTTATSVASTTPVRAAQATQTATKSAKSAAPVKPAVPAKAAAAAAGAASTSKTVAASQANPAATTATFTPASNEAPEFEVTASPEWDSDSTSTPQKKK